MRWEQKPQITPRLRKEYARDFEAMLNKWYEFNTSSGRLCIYLESYEWDEYRKDFKLVGHQIKYNNDKERLVVESFYYHYGDIVWTWPFLKIKKIKDKKVLRTIDIVFHVKMAKELLGQKNERTPY
jgi:hypothetical protein